MNPNQLVPTAISPTCTMMDPESTANLMVENANLTVIGHMILTLKGLQDKVSVVLALLDLRLPEAKDLTVVRSSSQGQHLLNSTGKVKSLSARGSIIRNSINLQTILLQIK